MTAQNAPTVYTIQALTDIWTGDAARNGNRTITTGLLGSIRWWFEVLVRGLGGSACDPTRPGNRCPDSRKKPTDSGHHCVVCELFGCTGWARKFRFEVLAENGQVKVEQIRQRETFKFRFTELRPIRPEEWALLDLTLRLIANYGAIGGKTTLKDIDYGLSTAIGSARRGRSGKTTLKDIDYGLISIDKTNPIRLASKRHDLEQYILNSGWRRVNHDDFAWASLENFWCVKGQYLARQNGYQRVLGRRMEKSRGQQLFRDTPANQWLAGRQQESKKVFSFKEPPRTFGFVKPGIVDFQEMRQRLRQAWQGFQDSEFLDGPRIIENLLQAAKAGNP